MGISHLPDGFLMWLAPKWWGPIKEAGDNHDILYELGGTKEDKWAADKIFSDALEAANHSKLARFFTACVLFGGHRHFNYCDKGAEQ